MNRFALLFPGQGSQYVGMGEDLYKNCSPARNVFDQANDILGFDLAKLCFQGPEEKLKSTENVQPAVLTVSIACLEALNFKLSTLNFQPEAVAGHSLGEYTALVAAGALEFGQALELVRQRGEFMRKASEENPGGMAAIIGLSLEQVRKVCNQSRNKGVAQVANLNCPGQIVISGDKESVKSAGEKAKTFGARKIVSLEVSGPFHSPLMKSAADKLAPKIEDCPIRSPQTSFVANVKGDFLREPSEIKEALEKQVVDPVRWEDSMRRMIEKGIKSFLEIGPGKVLSGLCRRIDRTVGIYNVEDSQSLRQTMEAVSKQENS